MQNNSIVSDNIFPLGEGVHPAFQQYYTGGPVFEKVLAPYDGNTGVTAAHVTYGPGSRNHWHSHPGGQLILALSGDGWHQEEGKEAVVVRPGGCDPDRPQRKALARRGGGQQLFLSGHQGSIQSGLAHLA